MIQTPKKIRNSITSRNILINWADGHEHTLSHRQLRAACRCASCRANHTQGKISLINEDLHVVKINNLGQGLQLVFSDGHERGIFPWQYLFDMGEQVAEIK
jgi:DUF971 family protein